MGFFHRRERVKPSKFANKDFQKVFNRFSKRFLLTFSKYVQESKPLKFLRGFEGRWDFLERFQVLRGFSEVL